MRLLIVGFVGCMLLIVSTLSYGQKMRLRLDNQVSSWGTINFSDPLKYQLGGRYLPTLSLLDSLQKSQMFDAEISLNAYGSASFAGDEFDTAYGKINPYRFWVRYSTPHLELRLGLQKINFGSATIFRPLMWFDRMDIRDPLQLTEGVYSLLARYYFQNNTNIWFWTLYGNDNPMGWSNVPSRWQVPELGGRIQQPVPRGEIALSYHHRQADYAAWYDTIPNSGQTYFPEDKIGLDGKWNVGAGIWFEYVAKHNDPANKVTNTWETYLNFGLDYTFSIGNGLNVTAEYFGYNNTDELAQKGVINTFTGLSANYPFGLMNTVTAVIYYNWEQDNWSRFISFQRKYDFWSFYLMAFWNPDDYKPYNMTAERSIYAGSGVQVMAVVNF
jgi:hypothetical protein